jgi:uncharacterized membrane protein
MFWLAAIVFLPFPTALLADGIDGGFAALYIGTLLAVSVLNLLIANYLAHHPELTDGEAAASERLADPCGHPSRRTLSERQVHTGPTA